MLWPSTHDSLRCVVNMYGGYDVNTLYTRFADVKLVGSLNGTMHNSDRFRNVADRYNVTKSYLKASGIPFGVGLSLTITYPRGILNKYPEQTLHHDNFLSEDYRQEWDVTPSNAQAYKIKELDYAKPTVRAKAASYFSRIINESGADHIFFDNFTINDTLSRSNTFEDLMKVIKEVKDSTGKPVIINCSLALNFWKQNYINRFIEICDGVCFEIYCRFRKNVQALTNTFSYARQLLSSEKAILLCPRTNLADINSCLRFAYLIKEGSDPIYVGDYWYRNKSQEFISMENTFSNTIEGTGLPKSGAVIGADGIITREYVNRTVSYFLNEGLPEGEW